jgi:hypothetical protein
LESAAIVKNSFTQSPSAKGFESSAIISYVTKLVSTPVSFFICQTNQSAIETGGGRL